MSHGLLHSVAPLGHDAAVGVSEVMQALSTPSRLLIIDRLRRSPLTVTELADAVDMEQSAVSHQLRVLRRLGLVVGERAGRRVTYSLHDDHVGALVAQAVGHVEHMRLGMRGHDDGGAR